MTDKIEKLIERVRAKAYGAGFIDGAIAHAPEELDAQTLADEASAWWKAKRARGSVPPPKPEGPPNELVSSGGRTKPKPVPPAAGAEDSSGAV